MRRTIDAGATVDCRTFEGSRSSSSKNTPSLVILPSACRSALQDTPRPTGQEAPWRGRRMTRTSWQKYLPPNCAPMPMRCVSACTSFSRARSRNARPPGLPLLGGAGWSAKRPVASTNKARSESQAARTWLADCRSSAPTRTSPSSAFAQPTSRPPPGQGGTAGKPRCRATRSSPPGTSSCSSDSAAPTARQREASARSHRR